MFCRWRYSYIEDGWDPINVCLYMFCRWRSSYIEDGWDPINICLYKLDLQRQNIYKQTLMGSQQSLLYNWISNGKTYINKR
jgi:hypothetical protein